MLQFLLQFNVRYNILIYYPEEKDFKNYNCMVSLTGVWEEGVYILVEEFRPLSPELLPCSV